MMMMQFFKKSVKSFRVIFFLTFTLFFCCCCPFFDSITNGQHSNVFCLNFCLVVIGFKKCIIMCFLISFFIFVFFSFTLPAEGTAVSGSVALLQLNKGMATLESEAIPTLCSFFLNCATDRSGFSQVSQRFVQTSNNGQLL